MFGEGLNNEGGDTLVKKVFFWLGVTVLRQDSNSLAIRALVT